jgi:GntR family L-lactate dehydrogenase operon transcriptional regulator
MERLGLGISEATAGRMLNRFDRDGLTAKVGYQGRVLTPAGQARLKELEGTAARDQQREDFLNLLRGQSKERLIDILVARKAIERELARLAAVHASPEEIRQMWRVREVQYETFAKDLDAGEQDVLFHRLIARAARNPVLYSAIEMIREDGQLTPVLEYIRKTVHSVISYDHAQIARAIERRDPAAAERAMVRHIENLIQDVNKYWDQAGQKTEFGENVAFGDKGEPGEDIGAREYT